MTKSRKTTEHLVTQPSRKSSRLRGENPALNGSPSSYDVNKHPFYDGENNISDFNTEDKDNISQDLNIHEEYINILRLGCIWPILLFLLYLTVTNIKSQETLPLLELFPNQSSALWNLVEYGKESKFPFVLMLVHQEFDQSAPCLAKCIAKTLALARGYAELDPILIHGDADQGDPQFMVKLKPQMENAHALVLLDVDLLDVNTAQKLHYVVDIFSPWVPNSVYILTMKIRFHADEQLFLAVSNKLTEKWGHYIKRDHLEPLITRVADSVIGVNIDRQNCPPLCEKVTTFK